MRYNAILLAGGLSTRMGQDKAMLSQSGVTLLQLAYNKITEVMKSMTDSHIAISGNYPEYFGITDLREKRGPIEGIWSCTRETKYNTAVLVFPVDMPLLMSKQFKLLFAQIEQEHLQDSGVEFIQFEDREMPFVFIYNKKTEKLLDAVRNQESNSKRSIRYFKLLLYGKVIVATELSHFINVNTPAEWKEVNNEASTKSE